MSQASAEGDRLPRAHRILEVHVENPTVRTLVLDARIAAVPGQFVMAWIPGLDEKPFSLSGADPLAITVARVGPFTTALHAMSPGDRIWLRGPYGRGFVPCAGTMMLVCGGCGAAPLLHLARVAREGGQAVHVVLGARTAEGLFFQERYAALGCAVHTATDDGSAGYRGTAIGLTSSLLEAQAPVEAIYACGPEPMLDALYLLAESHGLPCQLSYEAYMRCGIGVCGSCARGGCLVCRDGPVFSRPPKILASSSSCRP